MVLSGLAMPKSTSNRCRVCAGRKTLSVPVLHIHVYPSGNPASAAALLCLFLAVTYASVQYLCAARRHQADLEETALTPEPIIGEAAVMQQKEAWPVDHGQGVPQGDASSLPVDRSMQQPRKPSFKHHSMEDLFRNIHDLKQKLYGSNADVTVKGQRDLATAAAEIDRQVRWPRCITSHVCCMSHSH